MISFESDYTEGMHPRILKKLIETNLDQTATYGLDEYSEEARRLICHECGREDLGVHFFVGGTQTNLSFIASALKSYEGVISSDEGHINVHETGAIELTGHRIMAIESKQGKISAEQIAKVCESHYDDPNAEHTTKPGMVYLSQPTEYGSLYSKSEMEAIAEVCDRFKLRLFVDGARLAFALTSIENDLSLADLARLCDAFYIGGTKCGHMFGEALVITNKNLDNNFRYIIKQRGAMLAKGRFLGLGFMELFKEGLYFQIGRETNALALQIKEAFRSIGSEFFIDSSTNQLFPIVDERQLEILSKEFKFITWSKYGQGYYILRFVTSFATKKEDVEKLVATIKSMK